MLASSSPTLHRRTTRSSNKRITRSARKRYTSIRVTPVSVAICFHSHTVIFEVVVLIVHISILYRINILRMKRQGTLKHLPGRMRRRPRPVLRRWVPACLPWLFLMLWLFIVMWLVLAKWLFLVLSLCPARHRAHFDLPTLMHPVLPRVPVLGTQLGITPFGILTVFLEGWDSGGLMEGPRILCFERWERTRNCYMKH